MTTIRIYQILKLKINCLFNDSVRKLSQLIWGVLERIVGMLAPVCQRKTRLLTSLWGRVPWLSPDNVGALRLGKRLILGLPPRFWHNYAGKQRQKRENMWECIGIHSQIRFIIKEENKFKESGWLALWMEFNNWREWGVELSCNFKLPKIFFTST